MAWHRLPRPEAVLPSWENTERVPSRLSAGDGSSPDDESSHQTQLTSRVIAPSVHALLWKNNFIVSPRKIFKRKN